MVPGDRDSSLGGWSASGVATYAEWMLGLEGCHNFWDVVGHRESRHLLDVCWLVVAIFKIDVRPRGVPQFQDECLVSRVAKFVGWL